MCLCSCFFFFFFKQKTAYEMRISDWSSDVCSSDLSMEFGNFTVRNIFGYITSLVRQSINTGATPILQLPTGAGTSIPFVLFQAGGRQDREYITNEIGRAHV